MSDIQELKSEVVKALEAGLELAIDEFLALEASLISSMTASESRRADLRSGDDFRLRIDSVLHASPELSAARLRMQKLAAAATALKVGEWYPVKPTRIISAACGDHGGALNAPRDTCSTCQVDASHQEHEFPDAGVIQPPRVFYCGEHGGEAGNSQKLCPACRLPDVSVIRGGAWKPNRP